jgi:hypothetical protein
MVRVGQPVVKSILRGAADLRLSIDHFNAPFFANLAHGDLAEVRDLGQTLRGQVGALRRRPIRLSPNGRSLHPGACLDVR